MSCPIGSLPFDEVVRLAELGRHSTLVEAENERLRQRVAAHQQQETDKRNGDTNASQTDKHDNTIDRLSNDVKQREKGKNRLADLVEIVKNLNCENGELTDRVNELTEKVESLQSTNNTLNERVIKLENLQKADIASMRTLIEVLRKELEELKFNFIKLKEDDEESEV